MKTKEEQKRDDDFDDLVKKEAQRIYKIEARKARFMMGLSSFFTHKVVKAIVFTIVGYYALYWAVVIVSMPFKYLIETAKYFIDLTW